MCVQCPWGSKRALGSLGLEKQVLVSHTEGAGTRAQTRASGRAARVLASWVTAPAGFYFYCVYVPQCFSRGRSDTGEIRVPLGGSFKHFLKVYFYFTLCV